MAYSIYTTPNTYVGCGSFAIYAGVSQKNGEQVLTEIKNQLDLLLKDGVTEKEFREAKNQLRGGYMLGLESPGGRMQSMGRGQLHLDNPHTPEETIRHIEAVTREDVMRIARQVLSVEPDIAAVGKDVKAFE